MPVKLLTVGDFNPKPPDQARRLFDAKVPLTSAEFDQLVSEQRARAFRILGVQKVQLIAKAQAIVRRHIRDGLSIREAQLELMRLFGEAGVGQRPLSYLRLVLRQNTLGAFNIARKRVHESPAVRAALPYWQYLTVGDGTPGTNNVREDHARFHNKVFKWDDEFWRHFYPPWAWNCRCAVRAISADEVERKKEIVWTYAGGSIIPALESSRKADPIEAEPHPDFDFERDRIVDPAMFGRLERRLREWLEDVFEASAAKAVKRAADRN